MFEYKLTLNSKQAESALKAVELLMRLKLGQFNELPFALIVGDAKFCEKRDEAAPFLHQIENIYFGDRTPDDRDWKDEEWYRLYNIYQVLRYSIHKAEHPESKGVDSYPPMRFSDEPLPECEWRAKSND